MKKALKRYSLFIGTVFILAILFILHQNMGVKALKIATISFKEMILIVPPVFILMGLLDVWVPREIMVKYMGEKSGLKGIILSFVLGSAAAGPLYGAFPIAAVFMKKGVKLTNIFIFLGAWSTTKIPMFLFEMSSMGAKFAITRLLIDIPGIIIISYILYSLLNKEEIDKLYIHMENDGFSQ